MVVLLWIEWSFLHRQTSWIWRKFEGRDYEENLKAVYEENLKGIMQDLAILTGGRVGSFGNFLSHFASWLNTLSMCMFPFFSFFKVVVTMSSNCGVIPLMLGSCKEVRYLICIIDLHYCNSISAHVEKTFVQIIYFIHVHHHRLLWETVRWLSMVGLVSKHALTKDVNRFLLSVFDMFFNNIVSFLS